MSSSKIHNLKILPEYFQKVVEGVKPFEVRKNDRGFLVGDTLILKEWKPEEGYTGNQIVKTVSYILDNPEYLKDHYVVLGFCHDS